MSENLPTEIIADILSRLPSKPLLRFKSVSKTWYSLITSPPFTTLHVTHSLTSTTNRHLIISYSSLSSASLDTDSFRFAELEHPLKPIKPTQEILNYFPEPAGVELLGSCHGVVCVSNAVKNNVVLYNPSVRRHRKVAQSYIPYPEDFVVFGFGFDFSRGDFVVLRIVQCRESYCHVRFYNEAKVYSLRSDSWRWVNDMPYCLVYKDCHGVFVNEGLHFVVSRGEECGGRGVCIARFDLRSEGFSLVDCPEFEDELEVSKVVLGELGGCLCAMVNCKNSLCADLWVMKEYGKKESWVRLCCVEVEPRMVEVRPVAYSKDGRRVLLLVDNCEFHWCDLGMGSTRVKIVRGLWLLDEAFSAGVYVDSLVSLDYQGSSPRKYKKNDLDDFLSQGFSLRL